ncbi:hypothetical protein DFP72DRAFT_553022 [Ephemerocybe angulata]|uniref:Uncharacterized protein n=1 Tax=Ephemerocybe angulata TaxID=980116 RepID=A0A8H6LYQ2_9AGAR|nr:hypothetical protein DFP72DRAFT_553022 [Tulosesus angulatus]
MNESGQPECSFAKQVLQGQTWQQIERRARPIKSPQDRCHVDSIVVVATVKTLRSRWWLEWPCKLTGAGGGGERRVQSFESNRERHGGDGSPEKSRSMPYPSHTYTIALIVEVFIWDHRSLAPGVERYCSIWAKHHRNSVVNESAPRSSQNTDAFKLALPLERHPGVHFEPRTHHTTPFSSTTKIRRAAATRAFNISSTFERAGTSSTASPSNKPGPAPRGQ